MNNPTPNFTTNSAATTICPGDGPLRRTVKYVIRSVNNSQILAECLILATQALMFFQDVLYPRFIVPFLFPALSLFFNPSLFIFFLILFLAKGEVTVFDLMAFHLLFFSAYVSCKTQTLVPSHIVMFFYTLLLLQLTLICFVYVYISWDRFGFLGWVILAYLGDASVFAYVSYTDYRCYEDSNRQRQQLAYAAATAVLTVSRNENSH